jgi:hypothetical protein
MPRSGAAPRLTVVSDQHYADLGQVADFAASLPEAFLHCRELGHNWRPNTAGKYKDGGYLRVLRCSRCRTKRREELTSTGMKISTSYEHPDGYLTDGIGRIVGEGRGLLRLESMTRSIPEDAEELERG